MIDLVKTYEAGGLLLEDGELPDYLPVVLQFASTQPSTEARQFLGEIAHIIRLIFSALVRRESPYASLAGALLELADERAEAVSLPEEQDMDEAWAEPEVFGGCSIDGQASAQQHETLWFGRIKMSVGTEVRTRFYGVQQTLAGFVVTGVQVVILAQSGGLLSRKGQGIQQNLIDDLNGRTHQKNTLSLTFSKSAQSISSTAPENSSRPSFWLE